MSEGLTPDEIEDFYAETIAAPVEPIAINPAKIQINVVSGSDFAEVVPVKIKHEMTEIEHEVAETRHEMAVGEMDVAEIDNLATTIRKTEEEDSTATGVEAVYEMTDEKHHFFKRAHQINHRIWWRRVGTVATAVVAVIALALVGLRIAGFRTFTVMSGSMEPEYPVGAMIYVKPVDYKSLKVGDVISFVANNDKTVVTHRIAEIKVDENDKEVWRFKTKGDANNTADAQLVHYKNVIGTPVTVIPFIGYLAHNIQQPPGIYIALVVGSLLLAWTFLPGTLEGRRKTARNTAL